MKKRLYTFDIEWIYLHKKFFDQMQELFPIMINVKDDDVLWLEIW